MLQKPKVKGVKDVIKIDPLANPTQMTGGVVVIADSTWAAIQGRKVLKVNWDFGEYEKEGTSNINKQFKEFTEKGGNILRSDGDAEWVIQNAAKKIKATYQTPFMAHATMEPVNCVAHVQGDACELWSNAQFPNAGPVYGSRFFGLDSKKIKVNIMRIGGGFGRRLLADYVCEAIAISKAINAPVKVTWTREDDIQHDYYRPCSYHHVSAALDEKNNLIAWKSSVSSTSRYLFRGSEPSDGSEVFKDGFPASFVPNFLLDYSPVSTKVSTGAWRAPGHTANAFVDQ